MPLTIRTRTRCASPLFREISMSNFSAAQKPITVANFLKYVDQGRYFKIDPTTHHRASSFVHRIRSQTSSSKAAVISARSARRSDTSPCRPGWRHFPRSRTSPGFQTNAAQSRWRNWPAIQTARRAEWFINLADNGGPPNNLDIDKTAAYTVFGKVLGTGMTIVDKIATDPASQRRRAFRQSSACSIT